MTGPSMTLAPKRLREAAIRLHDASVGKGCAPRTTEGEWSEFSPRVWSGHFKFDEDRITAALDVLRDAGLDVTLR